jgi:hypothetical protein
MRRRGRLESPGSSCTSRRAVGNSTARDVVYRSEICMEQSDPPLTRQGHHRPRRPRSHQPQVGDRVVVSFNIACGTCKFCKKKYSSMCEYTNNSSMQEQMYGQRDAGFFGYGHLSELGCLSSGSDLVWAGLEHLSINPSRTSSETCTNAPDEVAEDAIDHR